jgi:hypothetical protein
MLRFFGFHLELFVEEVLDGGEGPTLCHARDFTGGQWLIVQTDDDPVHLAWMCAPVSARAMQAVRDGHCEPTDVLRHSATGAVELVTIDNGKAVPDRCVLGYQVSDHLPPGADHSGGGEGRGRIESYPYRNVLRTCAPLEDIAPAIHPQVA